jgi:type 1 glutamine amidotransferase
MQGASLVPLLGGQHPRDWRTSIYYRYTDPGHGVAPHYGVRTERFTLAHFPRTDEWELFDLRKDPRQIKNVFAHPAYARELAVVKGELSRLRAQYRDTSPPESSSGKNAKDAPDALDVLDVLILGGGKSHDFDRWFRDADLATLGAARYTDKTTEVLPALAKTEVLVLTTNQPLEDPALRKGLFEFVAGGKGLVVVHPAAWYNWKDWPEYNRSLVGGGARGHEAYGEFDVTVVDKAHAVTRAVPAAFAIADELYRFEKSGDIHPLVVGKSRTSGAEFPVAWTLSHGKGRIVGITLGHDGAAHRHAAYKALLTNAVAWVRR